MQQRRQLPGSVGQLRWADTPHQSHKPKYRGEPMQHLLQRGRNAGSRRKKQAIWKTW